MALSPSEALARLLDLTYTPGTEGRLIAVRGDPGSGKTHLLSALVQERQWTALPATSYRCTRGERARTAIDAVRALLRQARRPCGEEGEEVVGLVRERRRPDRELVVLEDVHLADERTVSELITFSGGTPAPLVDLVVTLRPRQTPPELAEALGLTAAFGRTELIDLAPLSDHEMLTAFGPSASYELRRRSGGNPFALRALQALEQDERAGADSPATPFELAVSQEVRDLTPHERHVLHAAAVLRSRFDVELLAEVAALDVVVASAAVHNLLRRDLVRAEQPVDTLFSIRDEVFGTLLRRAIDPGWAARAHQRAIRRLSARGQGVQLGFHLASSPSGTRQGELTRIIAAARELMESDVSESIYLLTPLLAETPHSSEAGLRVRLALCSAFGRVGRLDESRNLLFVVHEAASPDKPGPDAAERAEEVAFVSGVEAVLSQDQQTVDLLEEYLALPELRDTPLWPRLAFARGFRQTMQGRPVEHGELDAALQAGHAGPARAGLLALRALAELADGGLTAADEAACRSGELLDRTPEHQLARGLDALCAVAIAHIYLGRFTDARRHLQRGLAIARRRRHTYLLPTLLVLLSESERHLGLLEKARASADAAIIESSSGTPLRLSQAVALKAAAELWAQPPGSGRARGLARQALAQQAPSPTRVNGSAAQAALVLAQDAWLEGDPRHCIALLLNEGRGRRLAAIPTNQHSAVRELLCAAGMDAGLPLDDWAHLSHEHARRHATPPDRAYDTLIQGHLHRSQGALVEAARHYQDATALFAEAGMAVIQAYALGHAARVHAELGRAERARGLADLAGELARRAGAQTLTAWIDGLLGASTGPAAGIAELDVFGQLTAREREVAMLLCSGMKRSEIAERLAISARTVDVHLTRVYRKTGVASRVQLTLAVQRALL
ncbi:LuxR C-terminal-related transcriptional regulator [Actinocorallia libanotica]|uniref:HTH luxR-type domain-containing protein n=1 Tax=Actinocorallia libanotica TaxID=46162 RepID=A0ABP4BPJ7_9ACTN